MGFYYIIYTVLQCDLPPLKPPGPRFEPGPGGPEAGTPRPPHLLKLHQDDLKEKVKFIPFFIIVLCKTASAARN